MSRIDLIDGEQFKEMVKLTLEQSKSPSAFALSPTLSPFAQELKDLAAEWRKRASTNGPNNKRGRPPKNPVQQPAAPRPPAAQQPQTPASRPPSPQALPKRGPGRPKGSTTKKTPLPPQPPPRVATPHNPIAPKTPPGKRPCLSCDHFSPCKSSKCQGCMQPFAKKLRV